MALGVDANTASEILYGSIGSNTDLRDWAAIMASSNPIGDARASTAAMYNSTLNFRSPNAIKPESQPNATLLAHSGNFEYVDVPEQNSSGKLVDVYYVYLVDGQGYALTTASTQDQLLQLALNFGFDTTALKGLASQLDAKGIPWRSNGWSAGFSPLAP